ncbi:hypothetical protein CTRC122_01570 [Chlamydia trachomatis RC-J(s)/122]|nr:hypothetical protein CTRC943_01550 [Chlamydia trachomatis RC-J/943]AGR98359.1 hypothetical protein CTRC3_01570 [Chlamydia trachomatis RC-L2(s)/3]AGS00228.1 hypothetical protein CTRC122_01570 [Chlamydia trachomatis RC-J(s)/122]AGS03980.1 hypothetical protein CTRC55_01560 [Chlamydia trachomatis RC-L2/55]
MTILASLINRLSYEYEVTLTENILPLELDYDQARGALRQLTKSF